MGRRGRIMAGIALLGILALAIVLLIEVYEERQGNLLVRTMKRLQMATDTVAFCALTQEKPFDLPRGDIEVLCRWMETGPCSGEWKWIIPSSGDKILRDAWGNALVYRFPSPRQEGIFDLYSVGPNGVDEMGEGDDIAFFERSNFTGFPIFFRDGKVDAAWVKSHFDELRRSSADHKIIGTPDSR